MIEKPIMLFQCSCGKDNDISDVVFSPGFRLLGLTFKQLMDVCRYYRTNKTDWPPP